MAFPNNKIFSFLHSFKISLLPSLEPRMPPPNPCVGVELPLSTFSDCKLAFKRTHTLLTYRQTYHQRNRLYFFPQSKLI